MGAPPAHPRGDDQPRQGEGGEHRGDDADAERDGKAAHRPGADIKQHRGSNEGGDVGVENGGERAAEASVDGVDRRASAAHFLADAFIDQDVGVDRDTDGEHDAGDAGQRQRGIEHRQHAEDHGDVDGHRDIGEQAEQPIGGEHEDDHHRRADVRTDLAFGDRIRAEAGADGALLDDGQRRRQRAGAQQDGEIVGALHSETAGNLPGTAEDRLADHRRRDHLVVEHDGKRLPDVLLGHFGEFARPRSIEAKRDDRLAGALVKAGLRVGEIGARYQHALFDQIRRLRLARAVQHVVIQRHLALRRLLHRITGIDHAEIELGGLAKQLLEPGRILQARNLDQNAVGAFALDQRFHRAEFVDAPLDDLDRLIDRLAHPLDDRRLAQRKPDQAAGLAGNVKAALSGGAQDSAERLRQGAQLLERLIGIGTLANADFRAAAAHHQPCIADAGFAQHAAHVVAQRLQHFLANGLCIDLEQDVRAALQIEAEHDVALRPFRPARHHLLRQKIRNGEQANEQCRENNRQRFPAREIKHDVPT